MALEGNNLERYCHQIRAKKIYFSRICIFDVILFNHSKRERNFFQIGLY